MEKRPTWDDPDTFLARRRREHAARQRAETIGLILRIGGLWSAAILAAITLAAATLWLVIP